MGYMYLIEFDKKLDNEYEEKLMEFLNLLYDEGIHLLKYKRGELIVYDE